MASYRASYPRPWFRTFSSREDLDLPSSCQLSCGARLCPPIRDAKIRCNGSVLQTFTRVPASPRHHGTVRYLQLRLIVGPAGLDVSNHLNTRKRRGFEHSLVTKGRLPIDPFVADWCRGLFLIARALIFVHAVVCATTHRPYSPNFPRKSPLYEAVYYRPRAGHQAEET